MKSNIINVQTANNQEIISLRSVKTALKRALMDFEEQKQELLNDPLFDVYSYLQDSLGEGFAEPTIRKWTNINTTTFAEPEKLIVLCNQIQNRKPIDALILYMSAMIKGLN